ncbi:hypothetical protein [Sphingomonas rubra]|uniref:Peptidase inhibitor I78 family protein n=1 Tax=Sphingomonas rubra TaxID=634430 RepID=A0A1I5TXJ9_9SPHN|nr:hypothetical protein [Sphingomonas rubra]SFP87347.1 hypothetical protein SAMN04488241_109114 [Sphingomonas rubra]
MIRSRSTSILPAALLAPLMLVAACGGSPGGNDAAETANVAAPDGNTAATIRDLPAGQRTAVLLRAIRDAGRDCQGVTEATEVTAQGSPPTWAATCEDGNQWIVAIGEGGTATVTNRTELRQAGGKAG